MTSAFRGWPLARTTDASGRVEHERRRGTQDRVPPYGVQVLLGVDLYVRDSRHHCGDLPEDPPGRAARSAERRGELHQRRPLTRLPAEPAQLVGVEPLVVHGSDLPAAPPVDQPGRGRGGERAEQHEEGRHAGQNASVGECIPRAADPD
jgi:hypothetical protein